MSAVAPPAYQDFQPLADAADRAATIETDTGEDSRRGVGYQFDDGLKRAISAAMTLNRPLLVTGEPGCGKTELGYAISRNLPDRPIVRHFTCRSAGEMRDLFYSYDALARFHAIQIASVGGDKALGALASNFIKYVGLGRAALDAWGRETVTDTTDRHSPRRSVVIIDEIDKATRDFCNDLLDQLERFSFDVPEIAAEGRHASTPDGRMLPRHLRPIVVIASNSERLLPEPFLRRCVYHPIAPPTADMMDNIVRERLIRDFGGDPAGTPVRDAADTVRVAFNKLRATRLAKAPGTAELLDATVLATAISLQGRLNDTDLLDSVLSTLVKDMSDHEQARKVLGLPVREV